MVNDKGIEAEGVKKSNRSKPQKFRSNDGTQTHEYISHIDGISCNQVRACRGQKFLNIQPIVEMLLSPDPKHHSYKED